MREIKFRAWNKAVKKFTYFGTDEPSIECSASDRWGMFLKATSSIYLSTYEESQMYTGLKDKDSKEIYEGDILKIDHNNELNEMGIVKFGTGTFDSGYYEFTGFYLEYTDDHRQAEDSEELTEDKCKKNYTIIGNIYENAELFEREVH